MNEFEKNFTQYLKENFYIGQSPEFFASREYENSLNEHIHARASRFGKHLLPWISSVFDLSGSCVLEIGCGTGALTTLFAPVAKEILCYDVDRASYAAAKKRAEMMHWSNVSFEDEGFGRNCRFAREGKKADVAFFGGVVEHMDFSTFEDVVGTAWHALRPGGIMVVIDTPNRLCPFDFHTSWLPFYQWLPLDLRKQYYSRSPRQQFIHDLDAIKRASPHQLSERLQSWGRGVSYHDFELVLGDRVHEWIIADGWNDHIYPLANVFPDDKVLLSMFEDPHFVIKAHKGFARSWLYLVIQRPVY